MATTADYLNKLVTQKNTLADNLVTKGVTATHDETLETLVPKVLEISSVTTVTPESLGYASGAVNFFDGIYNFAHKHSDNGLFWIDLVSDFVMTRDSGSVYDDYYEKSTGTDSIFLGMKNMYDAFTFEVVCKINSYSGEFDFASNFEKAGAGVYAENGKLYASIRDTNAYKNIITSFNLGEMYVIQLTFDGNAFKFYLNGEIVGSTEVNSYVKSDYACSLGGFKNGSYANGSCNFYRFALYDRALTDDEIIKNYNSDKFRFNM